MNPFRFQAMINNLPFLEDIFNGGNYLNEDCKHYNTVKIDILPFTIEIFDKVGWWCFSMVHCEEYTAIISQAYSNISDIPESDRTTMGESIYTMKIDDDYDDFMDAIDAISHIVLFEKDDNGTDEIYSFRIYQIKESAIRKYLERELRFAEDSVKKELLESRPRY